MAAQKVYSIQINGLTESVKAVNALNDSLKQLESRINALQGKAVSVGAKASASSSLSEEAKLQKQIESIEEKRATNAKEIYREYLKAKDVLKETEKNQKSIAAAERLETKTYANTIAGMKQELADIKSAMQNVDLGDSDVIDKLVQRANELNTALKKVEESYGQFGRNVGNYRDSLNGITVTIGGVTREFNNSRQALRSLKQELDSLSTKENANSVYTKELRREYNKLKSAIDDATKSSKFMDEALDAMQSFTALNQISQGFSTFFGIDNSEMERQIARLVALQNALQGLEKINKQIDSEEGIGKWLAKGSRGIDEFVTKITGAEKRIGLFVGQTRSASMAINTFAKILKGVGAAGVIGGVMFLSSLIGETIDGLKKWANQGIETSDASRILASSVDSLTTVFDRLQEENLRNYLSGIASDAAFARNSINALLTQLKIFWFDVEKYSKTKLNFGFLGFSSKEIASSLEDAKKEYAKSLAEMEAYALKLSKSDSLFGTIKNAFNRTWDGIFGSGNIGGKKAKALGEDILNDFIARVQETADKAQNELFKFNKISESTKEAIKNLNMEANEDFAVNSVLNNVELFAEKGEQYAKRIDFVKKALQGLNTTVNEEGLTPDYLAQLNVDTKTGSAKIKAQNELNRRKEISQANGNIDVIKKINKKYDIELKESLKSVNESYSAALNDLNNLRIQNMREGLEKELAQLRQEKVEKIQAIIADGYLVGQRREEVEKLYDKKILDAKRDWAYEMLKTYQDLYTNIEAITKDRYGTELSNATQSIENRSFNKKNAAFGAVTNADNPKQLKKYYDEVLKIELDANKKITKIKQDELDEQIRIEEKEERLRHERVANAETTAAVMAELAKYEAENGLPILQDASDEEWNKLEESLRESLLKMRGELVDAYNAGKISFKEFCKLIEDEQKNHNLKMNALQVKQKTDGVKITNDELKEKQQAYNRYFQSTIALIRTQQDKISQSLSMQPVRGDNWGIVDIGKTTKNYEELISETRQTIAKILDEKKKLYEKKNDMNAEDFLMRKSELESAEKAAMQTLEDISQKQKNILSEFQQSINQYIQTALQGIQDIMNAFADYQDYQFEKQQEALDKEIDILQEKLDKQEEIVEKHKDKVNSIEDELADSRGDRRQHLIDQLNAEIAAQRDAQKEEQKIQKEKEAAERKQEALDKKRREAEYKRNLMSIIVSTAMATANGLATQPFVPVGIAMGALATTLGMVQLALARAQKPYAKGGQLDGGVAVGNRHRDGGIKVLGGRAEIEGGEFVTNRLTTSKNLDLLEYVNSKKKRIDISDMLEFYNGGRIKSSIKNVRTRFEDGGYLPTLPNNIDIREQLQDVIINQDNRPIYVSVVDINNKQDQVRRVQTLAGL